MKDPDLPILLTKVLLEKFNRTVSINPDNYIGDNPIIFRNWCPTKFNLVKWKENTELNDQYFFEFIGPVLLEFGINKIYIKDTSLFDSVIKLYKYSNNGWKPFATILNSADAICFNHILNKIETLISKCIQTLKTDIFLKSLKEHIEKILGDLYREFSNQDLAINYYSVKIDDDTTTHILQKEGKRVVRVNFTTSKNGANYTISLLI